MAGEKLVKIMKEMSGEGVRSSNNTDIVFGEVSSTSPLQIKVDNRFIIDEDFIILSSLCERKTIDIEQNDITTEVELWRGLQVGDRVVMLRVSAGQLYYVMERSDAL